MKSSIIATPCRKVCVLDSARAQCLGCGRTLEEIAAWPRMSEEERRLVMADLSGRLDRLAGGRRNLKDHER